MNGMQTIEEEKKMMRYYDRLLASEGLQASFLVGLSFKYMDRLRKQIEDLEKYEAIVVANAGKVKRSELDKITKIHAMIQRSSESLFDAIMRIAEFLEKKKVGRIKETPSVIEEGRTETLEGEASPIAHLPRERKEKLRGFMSDMIEKYGPLLLEEKGKKPDES